MPYDAVIDEPLLELGDIQGNIVPGFKKDHQHFLFFRIEDMGAARKWLVALGPRLSSATEVLEAHQLWKAMRKRLGREPENIQFVFLNAALSASGLRQLTSEQDVKLFADSAFKLGMKERSEFLGDPSAAEAEGHVDQWLVGGTHKPVDLMLTVASDDRDWLLEVEHGLIRESSEHGLKLVHRDYGRVQAGKLAGHEHFGFKDGVSDPAIRGRWATQPDRYVSPRSLPPDPTFDTLRADFAAPGQPLVWPGHFLFGHARQELDNPQVPRPTDKPRGPAWAENGAFLVYRRLRQHVEGFEDFLSRTVKSLKEKFPRLELDEHRLGALLVGRWKSGTPVMRSPDKDAMMDGAAANYFRFSNATQLPIPGDTAMLNPADPNGEVCPLGAHIRKVNPRDDATDLGPGRRTLAKLIIRRGITYDGRVDRSPESPDDRGLLFVSYQSSIESQFEFLMRDWVNRSERPRSNGGHDPILAQGPDRYVNLLINGQQERISLPGNWVVPTGGEYFFSPSIQFFEKTLAQVA